jgi:PAS domain S-box-containing protein
MQRILYVDDEPSLLEIAKIFLEQTNDFSVDIDTSAQHSLISIGTRNYDAIISDYQMPEMDGIAFLKAVRSSYGDIPFILFTGRGREEVVIDAINNGADFYLQKGGDPTAQFAELTHKIRQAIARRQAEFSLIESEKRLTDIINFLPDATFAIDRSGKVIAWNRAIEDMTGIPATDMLGKGEYEYAIPFYNTRRPILIDLIFEPDEEIEKNYAHIVHEKDMLIAETMLPRPKGRTVTLMGKASPLYNRGGKIVGAIESIRDITNLKKAEEGMVHAQKDWETIFRAIGHPAIVLNANNEIIDANDAAFAATGNSMELLKGKHCYEVFHGKEVNRPPEGCPFEQLKKTGTTETAEMEMETLKGYYHVSCTPVYDANGRLEKVIHIAMDVTARRQAQDELRAAYEQITASEEELRGQLDEIIRTEQEREKTERNFRILVDNAPDAIYIQTNNRFVYLNNAALKLLGASSADELLGKNPFDRIHPSFHERIRQRVKNLTVDLQPVELLDEICLKLDGTPVDVEVSAVPYQYDGQNGALVMVRDITVRKKAESELRAAYEQISASEEELRGQYEALAWSEQRIRESEEKLSSIFRAAPVGIGLVSNRILLSVNDRVCELTGYSTGELIGKSARILYPTDEEFEWVGREKYKQIRKSGTGSVETSWQRKDGSIRDILLSSTPLDPADLLKGITFTALDITERKEAVKNLHAQERLLDDTFSSIRDGISILDTTLSVIRVNKTMEEWYSHNLPLVGRKCWEVYQERTERCDVCPSFETLQTGMPAHETIPMTDSGKTVGWLELYSFPLIDSVTGKMTGVIEYVRNITEQKLAQDNLKAAYERLSATDEELRQQYEELAAAQAELRKNRQQLDEIASTIPGVVYQSYSRADGKSGAYYVSSRAPEVFGISNEAETFFERFTAQVDPRDRDAFLSSIEKAVATVSPWDFEGRFTKISGENIWFQGTSRAVRSNTEVLHNGVLLDITSRKKAEETLRENEKKLRTLIETTGTGFVILDTMGRVLDANPEYIRMTGHKELDEIAGREIFEWTAEHSKEKNAEAFRQCIHDGFIHNLEVGYTDPAGKITTIEINASVVQSENSVTVLTLCRDISKRKQEEEEQRLLKISADHSSDEIFWLDFSGTILYVNDSACRITGYTREELCSMKIFELDPDFPPYVWEKSVADLRERKTQFISTRHRRKDGVLIDVDILAVYVNQGDREFSFAYVRDVTERKREEEALRESEERFRRLISVSFDAVIVHQEGRIVLANDSAARIMGVVSAGELVGKPVFDLVDPAFRNIVAERVRETLQSKDGTVPLIEERFIRIDGTAVDVEVMATATLHEGRPAVMVVFRDIKDRKQAEEELFNSRQMLQAVLDTIPQRVFWKDRNSVFLGCNRPLALDAGFSDPVEIVGKTDYDHASASTADLFRADDLQVMETAKAKINFEETQVRPDGSKAWLLTSKVPLRNKKGNIIGVLGTYDDITDRKGAEARLMESEEKYRSLFENNQAVMLLIDPDTGDIVDANPAACNFYHWSRDEFIKKRIDEINTMTTAEIRAEMRLASAEKRNHFFFKHRLADGTARDVEVYSAPIRLGGKLRLYSIIFDVTDRKRVEESLKSSESRLRLITDNMVDQISQIDKDRTIIYISPSVERLMGYVPEDLIGQNATEFIHPDDRDYVVKETRTAINRHLPSVRLEYRFRHKDGSYQWFESETRILYDDSGEYNGAIFTSRDITQRKKIEDMLREKTEELNQYFSVSLDLFCIADTDGYFRRLNPEWERTLGYTLPELEGQRFFDFVHPDDMQATISANAALADQKEVIHFINRYRHKDGSYRWIEWKSVPRGKRIFAAARDITDRKNLEQAIQEINRKLNLLTSITRHDVSNQVSVLRGFAKIAMMKKPDPVIVDLLAKIDATGAVIDRHIAFTKEYQELGMHAPGWHRIRDLVEHQKTPGITVSCTCEAEAFADPMLEKVFINLFDNAARHGERVTTITVSCKPTPEGIVISVEDNGIGVPLDKKEKIFEKGYGKHTGFGLFLAREILGITGITIHETGIHGKGARFEIHVPKGKYRGAT